MKVLFLGTQVDTVLRLPVAKEGQKRIMLTNCYSFGGLILLNNSFKASWSFSSFVLTASLKRSSNISTLDVVVGISSFGDSLFSTFVLSISCFLGTKLGAVLFAKSLILFFTATSTRTAPRFAWENWEEVVFRRVDTIFVLSSIGLSSAGVSGPSLASTPAWPTFRNSSSPVPATLAGEDKIVAVALTPK